MQIVKFVGYALSGIGIWLYVVMFILRAFSTITPSVLLVWWAMWISVAGLTLLAIGFLKK